MYIQYQYACLAHPCQGAPPWLKTTARLSTFNEGLILEGEELGLVGMTGRLSNC